MAAGCVQSRRSHMVVADAQGSTAAVPPPLISPSAQLGWSMSSGRKPGF